jgi:hypothetical protein
MTPKELVFLADGYRERDRKVWELAAWQTAYLMNSSGNYKEPITADMLLGRKKANHPDRKKTRKLKSDMDWWMAERDKAERNKAEQEKLKETPTDGTIQSDS